MIGNGVFGEVIMNICTEWMPMDGPSCAKFMLNFGNVDTLQHADDDCDTAFGIKSFSILIKDFGHGAFILLQK